MQKSFAKENLRKELLEMRRAMAFEEVYALSGRAQKRFIESEFYASARSFSLYSSFQNEVLTDEIFQRAVKAGKKVAYPRVIRGGKRHLAFFSVRDLKDLATGSYDIPEPGEEGTAAEPDGFDLIVVPGAAFDMKGGRLGYGKGYYDRALKGLGCPIVALAYEFQVLKEDLPVEPHDVSVTAIVTEKRILKIGR